MNRDFSSLENMIYYLLVVFTFGGAFLLRIIVTAGVREYFRQKKQQDIQS